MLTEDKLDVIKRGVLERHLRFFAFENTSKFPELLTSTPVRAWERQTLNGTGSGEVRSAGFLSLPAGDVRHGMMA